MEYHQLHNINCNYHVAHFCFPFAELFVAAALQFASQHPHSQMFFPALTSEEELISPRETSRHKHQVLKLANAPKNDSFLFEKQLFQKPHARPAKKVSTPA